MTDDKQFPRQIQRVSTGIEGLDTILHGGLVPKRIYLFTGVAGAGKTTLAHHIVFQTIADGGKAVYITLLEETHSQLFENLATMEFFSRAPIGNTLHYFSGSGILDKEGLRGLFAFLQEIVREYKPDLLVLDTLLPTASSQQSETEMRWFMKQLSVFIEVNNCTVIILSYPTEDDMVHPQAILADAVIDLSLKEVGQRVLREIKVRKLRASNFIEGRHAYQITGSGVVVYPRTEARYVPKPSATHQWRRMPLGIAQLDNMLQGGVFSRTTTMLLGVPGSGKTLTGLHFLAEGAKKGEAGLYFGFYETPGHLITKAEQIGLELGKHVQSGVVEILWFAPLENLLDDLAERLLNTVRRRKVSRVFIDGLAGFQQAADFPGRLNRFFSAIANELRELDVTTLFSVEMAQLFGPIVEFPVEGISIIADNIIFLRYVELHSQLFRLISIIKLRDSEYDTTIREFKMTANGIEVAETFASAQAILTGVATPIIYNNQHPPSRDDGM